MSTKGLGKGLGALIASFDDLGEEILPQKSSASVAVKHTGSAMPALSPDARSSNNVVEIPLDQIDNNVNQPRKDFNSEKLYELAESIKANGVVQPILLNRVGSRYIIVAGERRWRASKIAGLKTIPSIIQNYTATQSAEIAIIENLQRADLNEIELARGIRRLMDEHSLTHEQISTRLGKSRSTITNTLRLLTLPSEIVQMIEQGTLSAGHAKLLVSVTPSANALALARKCVELKLSVRDLEKLISDRGVTPTTLAQKLTPPQSLELKELQRSLTAALSTKVTIQGNSMKGKVTIEYFSMTDLAKIKKLLTGDGR